MMKCKDCDTDMKELFDNLLRRFESLTQTMPFLGKPPVVEVG